jgi:hypothetical protein
MEQIVVGFSKPKTFKPYAWLIMFGYGVPYSHVYVKLESKTFDRTLIYQASSTMVNFMNEATFNEHNEVVREFTLDVPELIKRSVIQYSIDQVGKPYGVKEAFGLAIIRLGEILGQRWKNPFADGHQSFVCSELVADILIDVLWDQSGIVPDDITPKDLFELLEKITQNNSPDNRG